MESGLIKDYLTDKINPGIPNHLRCKSKKITDCMITYHFETCTNFFKRLSTSFFFNSRIFPSVFDAWLYFFNIIMVV